MKQHSRRALDWMIRVYPRAWRERYEDELRSLLDDAPPHWTDWADVFKEAILMRIRCGITLKALAGGLAAAAIAALTVWLMPVTYESQAVVSTKAKYSRDRTMTDEINLLAQRALSRESLIRVMEQRNLYPRLRANGQVDTAIRTMLNGIRFTKTVPRSDLGLTSISFRYSDPYMAKMTTRDLVSNFIDENIRENVAELEAEGKPLDQNVSRMVAELVVPADDAHRPSGPKPATVVAFAGAEGLQLGLIVALLQRRKAISMGSAFPDATDSGTTI